MKHKLLMAVLLFVFAASINQVHAGNAKIGKARLTAAAKLLEAMQAAENFDKAIKSSLDMRVKQQPALAPYRKTMMAFFAKYTSWNSLKGDMAKIYAAEFTIKELKELTAFYNTPLGKKVAKLQPTLMAKGRELGARRVQTNMGELKRMIQAETIRIKKMQKLKTP